MPDNFWVIAKASTYATWRHPITCVHTLATVVLCPLKIKALWAYRAVLVHVHSGSLPAGSWITLEGGRSFLVRRVLQNETTEGSGAMSRFFIERRENEGDYAIRRPGSDRASGTADTQWEAIERAREMDPDATIEVERVRDTNRGGRDKWRKP